MDVILIVIIKNKCKILLIFAYIIILINFLIKEKKKKELELKDMQDFININLNQELININQKFHKISNPKISVIISVYNGEAYLKTALRSIQNQDFMDLEIIIVDDHSKDNSVNLIKELMKEDPRIIFTNNNKNKGALYTKTKGILIAKGKYVLTLDVDDLFTSKKAFSTLYIEAEKNKLDLLGFNIR